MKLPASKAASFRPAEIAKVPGSSWRSDYHVSAGSKLQDVPLADLAKLCKGTQKSWPDGKSFLLVIKNPEAPEMHVAVQKLFGDAGGDVKATIAKLNELRLIVKIVGSDEELLHIVETTPGA